MSKEPIKENRFGFFVIATYYKGRYQGAIRDGRKLIHHVKYGTSLEEVYDELMEWFDRNTDLVREHMTRKHFSFLRRRGFEGDTAPLLSPPLKPSLHRTSRCWACRHPVDNRIQFECTECGWIVCGCGACGCGYRMG